MPFRLYVQLGRDGMKKVDRGITMINHTKVEAMRILTNVLCQVGVTTLIDKFLILDILINLDLPIVVGRGFLRMIGAIVNTPERLFSTFDGFCHQTFRAARSHLRETQKVITMGTNDDEEGCNRDAKSRMGCDGEIDDMLRIMVHEAESDEEIFTSVAWIRAFNINEPIYAELFHEFYSTYEFDELCADDELQTKKIIKRISREDNLGLSRSHTSTIRKPILRTPKWVYKCSLGDCEMDEEERSWASERESNLLWDLDTTTLRDLIDSDGKLIPEDPQPGVPRVGIPRPSRASMQDLYDRMGRMEIRQEAIERMEYRQSYH
ncbi:hypothetical protein Tco_1578092 [Tanacetum coccineum]